MTIPALVPILTADLTTATVDGTGLFDTLMRATKAHLEQEYKLSRIKGPEYATVYLGSLESTMRTSLEFLMTKQKNALDAQLIGAQVAIAEIALLKASVELAILEASLLKVPAEIALLEAQTLKVTQETANAVIEGTVLTAQKCKLDAEFDNLMLVKLKTTSETALLTQKKLTEQAQVTASGVDADSVIGRQKLLYEAQSSGYARDAEQKAADLMIKTWNVRRTTDEATVADGTNKLSDLYVGNAVTKLLSGIGA